VIEVSVKTNKNLWIRFQTLFGDESESDLMLLFELFDSRTQ